MVNSGSVLYGLGCVEMSWGKSGNGSTSVFSSEDFGRIPDAVTLVQKCVTHVEVSYACVMKKLGALNIYKGTWTRWDMLQNPKGN